MTAERYPVRIERDAAERYLATCRDVPEALTDGAERNEAKAEMADALMRRTGGLPTRWASTALAFPPRTARNPGPREGGLIAR